MKHLIKKMIMSFLVLILFFIPACGNTSGAIKENQSGSLSIVTSFYPMYIFTENIIKGIPNITLSNMTEPQTGCLHDYQLRPSDLKNLENANVFIINGAGMESFLDRVLEEYPKLPVIQAAEGIPLIKDTAGLDNPHVWVSISGAIEEVKAIGSGLQRINPANAQAYKINTEAYVKKLETLRDKMHQKLDGLPNRDIVTFHEAFPYFAKEFNLNILAVIEREPGSEPSAGELASTIQIIKDKGSKILFAEPQYTPKAAKTISDETGAKIFMLDPAVTGQLENSSDSYEKIMETNMLVLEDALSAQ
jgi:zinc transport system substrate-binding protein